MTTAQVLAIATVVLPALAFALWPLARRRGAAVVDSGVPPGDRRLELLEEKTSVYRALKELAFDHEAGHLSDDDYQALSERYESRAAELLGALDALPPAVAAPAPAAATAGAAGGRGWTRHPLTLAAGAALLVIFGVVVGLNAGRFSTPEQSAMPPGSRIPVPASPQTGGSMPPVAGMEPGKPISPEVFAGMLKAARQSLDEGRYPEAIAAYQAVLKRDPRNVDAMTHLGLIVAIGGHADAALETFDKALAIDSRYAPPYLYRGQILYEVKQDYPGAVKAWEHFLSLVPSGEDHDRIAALVKEARAKRPAR